jgi:hypothetical protein
MQLTTLQQDHAIRHQVYYMDIEELHERQALAHINRQAGKSWTGLPRKGFSALGVIRQHYEGTSGYVVEELHGYYIVMHVLPKIDSQCMHSGAHHVRGFCGWRFSKNRIVDIVGAGLIFIKSQAAMKPLKRRAESRSLWFSYRRHLGFLVWLLSIPATVSTGITRR